MRYIVLGAGMQGWACAFDLLQNKETEKVTLVDRDPAVADAAARRLGSDRVRWVASDCTEIDDLSRLLDGHQVAISALPYRLNLGVARAALDSGVHLVDMGGNIEVVLEELGLDQAAKEAGVTLVPDCGLAPGLANVLVADAVSSLKEVREVHIRVGGLPATRRPPWDYMLLFSFEGLVNEYTGTAAVLKDGNRWEEEVLTGVERLSFPEPVGECEAAYTSGGSSTLPWTYAGQIRDLNYKTVRYPGHFEKLRALSVLGLFGAEPVEVGKGVKVVPRKFLEALAVPRLTFPKEKDVVVLRVESKGLRGGKPVRLLHEMMDFRDQKTGLTAMMRTTAYPTTIIAQMIAEGTLSSRGAFPPERVVSPEGLISELGRRGVLVRRRWEELEEEQSPSW